MQVVHNGITLIVPDQEVVRMALDRLNGNVTTELVAPVPFIHVPPRLGEYWSGQGGIYAGVCAGAIAGLDRDYHLILGPEHDDDLAWQPFMDWTRTVEVDGHRDFLASLRKEQRILFANVGSHFKDRSYWSGEQHASNSDYAWLQDFNNGDQDYWFKISKLRGRVVRRLTI